MDKNIPVADLKIDDASGIIISIKRVENPEYYLGIQKGIDEITAQKIGDSIQNFLKMLPISGNTSNNTQYGSHHVRSDRSIAVDLNNAFRVYGKIAFNCLTYLEGRDFILTSQFDNLRQAILTGKNINQYVYLFPENKEFTQKLSFFIQNLSLDKNLHSIIIFNVGEIIYANLFFYGFISPVGVIMTKIYKGPFINHFYYCDFVNKKEGELSI